jgi:hypothetical protein
MSRSVWHKLRESKFSLEAIQWAEMLQGLQPARKPIPGGMSWVKPGQQPQSERKISISPEINPNFNLETSCPSELGDTQQEQH